MDVLDTEVLGEAGLLRCGGALAVLVVGEGVLGIIALLVGGPEGLLEVKDLAGLQAVELLLLGELLVESLDGLSQLVLVGAQLELVLELTVLLLLKGDLVLMFGAQFLELADVLLLLDQESL